MKKECVAMLLAGGQGSRLYVLTGDMAKPAVPFGGKFRIIDFPLSNCANSGIDTVGVLTQYRPLELNSYIGNGQPWELDRLDGGVHILPPYQSATGASWYKGTANAIYQNIGFVDLYDPEYVAVLSGDHIYKMDYAVMLRRHKETGAACTIAVMEVPWAEASRFGIMSVDGEDRITEFAEKPKEPKSNLASMGIYVFTWKTLRRYLEEGLHVGLGSDVAGGSTENLFTAMSQAIQASKLRWRLQDDSLKPLTAEEVFYMASKGGGAFFGKTGSFEPGYEFDAVIIDDSRLIHPQPLTVKQRLERVIYLGDEREVYGKYACGEKIL